MPIHNRLVGPPPQENRRQAPPNDPGPSNSQDVRFMDSTVEPQLVEPFVPQAPPEEDQSKWPPTANVIIYELRSSDEETTHEAPALAVTTIV